jgi:hypothetical protein
MGPVQWSVGQSGVLVKKLIALVNEKALVKRKPWAGRRGGRGGRANAHTTA